MLPDVGTLPGAVSEAWLSDFPLLEGQRLINAWEWRGGGRYGKQSCGVKMYLENKYNDAQLVVADYWVWECQP